jgi:hypothetical protein
MTEIVERAVRDLIPYARNPRKNDAVVDQMAASIREFGFKAPILALSDGTIVDGHLRLKAAPFTAERSPFSTVLTRSRLFMTLRPSRLRLSWAFRLRRHSQIRLQAG